MSDEKRDVRAITRTYEKDGETKNFYQTVGTAWVSEHGSKISIQLETLPISKDWDGRLFINKPYEKKEDGKFDKDIQIVKEIGEVKDELPTDEDMEKPIDISEIPF